MCKRKNILRNRLTIKYFFAALIPCFTFFYGFGDYFKLWDKLSGRASVENSLVYLHYNSYIDSDHTLFKPLVSYCIKHLDGWDDIEKQVVIQARNDGLLDDNFRLSLDDTAKSYLETQFNYHYAQKCRKEMYGFEERELIGKDNYVFLEYTGEEETDCPLVFCLDSIQNIKRAIDNHKRKENFLILTLLFGCLSMYVAIFNIRHEKRKEDTDKSIKN